MTDEIDPYQVLGITPETGRQEVRRAFHEAVLRCHPDCTGGDTEEAQRRFGRLVAAYRTLRAQLAQQGGEKDQEPSAGAGDAFDPADFAWLAQGWESLAAQEGLSAAKLEWLPRLAREKVVEPACNETAAFVACWVAAVVLALIAGAITTAICYSREQDEHPLGVTVAVMLGTYVAGFAASLVAILTARKTSWLLRVIGFRKQHSLPGVPKGRKLADDQS